MGNLADGITYKIKPPRYKPGGLEFLKIVTAYMFGGDSLFAKGGKAHHLCGVTDISVAKDALLFTSSLTSKPFLHQLILATYLLHMSAALLRRQRYCS